MSLLYIAIGNPVKRLHVDVMAQGGDQGFGAGRRRGGRPPQRIPANPKGRWRPPDALHHTQLDEREQVSYFRDVSGSDQRIAVLGTGNMGSAIAGAVLKAGHSVTVWNRTRARCDALVARGASASTSVASAVASADLVFVCLIDAATTHELLEAEEASDALRGKALVEFSTGTPADARAAHEWTTSQGATYLGAAILAYPRAVGTTAATFVYSGARSAYEHALPALEALGNATFAGEDPALAEIVNLGGVGVFCEVALGAFVEAAAFAHAEGDALDQLRLLLPQLVTLLVDSIEFTIPQLQARDFDGTEASINVHTEGLLETTRALALAGVQNRLSTALLGYLKDARSIGAGQKEFAAVIDVMSSATPAA
jgi:3-hydroxyisobutyrate dehydrogenase-like beta-hydroxyacid dehydrogenase